MATSMFCQELVHCSGIELASRYAKTLRKGICRTKYLIRDGYGSFHTESITRVILIVKNFLRLNGKAAARRKLGTGNWELGISRCAAELG